MRVIFGDDDEPYFVVEDICDILKISDGRLNDEDKIRHKLNDEQEIIVTSEFGLYDLIMNSVGEKEFKRWILRKILPIIRTTAQIKSYPSQELIHVLAVQKKIIFDEALD
ncbi:MAG: BRO family protein [Trichodesmium sp. MO_231.B1]|nr:BRO family protein [Trichodesmium sp. MO_231.B1]